MPPIVGTARSSIVADAILPSVGGVSNGKARCAGVMHSPPFGRTSAQHRANAILQVEKIFPLRGNFSSLADCASRFPVTCKLKRAKCKYETNDKNNIDIFHLELL